VLSTLVVLAVFTAPATCLFRLKGEISDRRYTEIGGRSRVPKRRAKAKDKEARELGRISAR
jgi:hypothetical protein